MNALDGNTAALNEYQRQEDALASTEQALEVARAKLSDDLFDAYMTGNWAAIDEIEDRLTEEDVMNHLLKTLRHNFSFGGRRMRTAYMRIIAAVCDEVAKKKSIGAIERFRHDFDL